MRVAVETAKCHWANSKTKSVVCANAGTIMCAHRCRLLAGMHDACMRMVCMLEVIAHQYPNCAESACPRCCVSAPNTDIGRQPAPSATHNIPARDLASTLTQSIHPSNPSIPSPCLHHAHTVQTQQCLLVQDRTAYCQVLTQPCL